MTGKRQARKALPIPRRALITAGVLVCLSASLLAAGPSHRQRITFLPSRFSVLAERADTPEARERGLMYRKSLGDSEAMIFTFENTSRLTFWMYHTLIPLTIIFLDDTLKIVDMQLMAPCRSEEAHACPVYTSRAPARYAVEVNQDFVGKHRIKLGDRVELGEIR
jgi:hypothetical protein